MTDERLLKTPKDAASAQAGAMRSLHSMLEDSAITKGWLYDLREIVLEWIAQACRVTFKNEELSALWRPLAAGGPTLTGQADRSVQGEFLDQVKWVAHTFTWARLHVEDEVQEEFARGVLATVLLLSTVDATLAKFDQGDLLGAYRCFETISLASIMDPPDPYRVVEKK
jgi:hypothetical protein